MILIILGLLNLLATGFLWYRIEALAAPQGDEGTPEVPERPLTERERSYAIQAHIESTIR